jgi:hypothetical protein
VAAYLRVRRAGNWDGEPEALRAVCQEVEFLLRTLVNPDSAWNASCDGINPATDILPEAVEVAQPFDLRLRGKAYWLPGDWITPFFFSARVAEEADSLSEYLIQVGDAGRGLARENSGKRLKDVKWFYPEKWVFTFRKP